MHTVTGRAGCPGDAVRLQDREPDPLFPEEGIHAGIVAAFGKPEALWARIEVALVTCCADLDLCLHALIKAKHPELRPFQLKTVLWATAANVREAPQVAGRLSRVMRPATTTTRRATSALRL